MKMGNGDGNGYIQIQDLIASHQIPTYVWFQGVIVGIKQRNIVACVLLEMESQ